MSPNEPHAELGGDPPCWEHLFENEVPDQESSQDSDPFMVDLGSVASGSGGAIWSLPHGGDLDANLVRLDSGGHVGSHINDDVDVLLIVQSGTGEVTVNEHARRLAADHLVLIPRGSRRSILAGETGVTYLSIHRRRSPLGIRLRTNGAR